MSIYQFTANDIDGNQVSLDQYRGKTLIIVNTASKCGFTPQYEGLQELYDKYREQGLEILGFPCNQFLGQEPGDAGEIKGFCSLNYGVSFPLFEKVDVNGADTHPLFAYLKEHTPLKDPENKDKGSQGLFDLLREKFPSFLKGNAIRWNFTKFVIDKNGNITDRFEPAVTPKDMEARIQELLKA